MEAVAKTQLITANYPTHNRSDEFLKAYRVLEFYSILGHNLLKSLEFYSILGHNVPGALNVV